MIHRESNPRLCSVLLNEFNYLPWSRAISLALGGRSKLGYVNGTIKPPGSSSATFDAWHSNDQLVMSWILNSMEPKLSEIFSYSDSSHILWESIKEMYGSQHNAARVFELKKSLAGLKQGNQTFIQHLGSMKSMWNELDLYRPHTTESAALLKRADEDKVFQLLASLGVELPTRVLNSKSPFEVIKGRTADLTHFRIFGCTCYVHIQANHRDKLEPRAIKCVFMGYSSSQKGYKCYNPHTGKLVVSRDVRFDELVPFFNNHSPNSSQGESLMDIFPLPTLAEIHTDTPPYHPINLPKGKKAVGSRWIYKIKFNSNGTIERHKARLVARGFTQTYGIDYKETFAPVAKMNTVRVLLSVAVNHDWPLFQMDVKNAFLHGELQEEVYMKLPPGHPQEQETTKVCKLHKAIYGLKQSPRAWYAKLSSVLEVAGFKRSHADSSLFVRSGVQGKLIVLIYVDDLIITGDNMDELEALKRWKPCHLESKKQTVVARSSAEAEYRAMAATASELIWLKSLLLDLGFTSKEPMSLFCDNQAAMHIASNPVFHERTKHIEVNCHFIRTQVQSNVIETVYTRSHDQLADLFTKALDFTQFQRLLFKLGSINPLDPA
ncbi:hypothetical protein D8674_005027 [Pyrus ussuriensis x Pyrus communis]|uniref:Reverse transcriptase Ty1/copia-type domain-containing protein n=1 Tax=Pyrus ussuriensis x Pyrus communis TaxID=2448454 RepID=A0A5N5FVA2_9ROSA|nr:hypothetical protein D8674_005027 [Pyrus ussuriensis x Pyrus communis]